MAVTVLQAFREFKANLEITDLQHTTVSTRQQNVRRAVEDELDVLDSFLTGSYSRHTMIAPLKDADVDIFIVFNPKYYEQNGQATLLDRLKRTLRRTYPNTPDISRNGQAVTIQFTDFAVDVVPAFKREGGYLIPNSTRRTWIETDPKEHVEIITDANKKHNNDLVPLIKMIKGWNRCIHRHFYSFHLEVLALQILEGVTITNSPSGMRFFFDKGRSYIRKKNPDPAGYGGDVGGYLNTQERIDNAASRFETAYDRAIRAEDCDRRGYIRDAIDMWKRIFGDYFPAYG